MRCCPRDRHTRRRSADAGHAGLTHSLAARFALLFAAQFAAGGILMPFVPVVLADGGLDAAGVALVLGVGTALRLVAAPLLARRAAADGRGVLATGALVAGLAALGYPWASGLLGLLLVHAVHSLALAPVIPLSDALALSAARAGRFEYGPVRSVGSAAFIAGALAAGLLADRAGAAAVLLPACLCLLAAAFAARTLPAPAGAMLGSPRASWAPLRDPSFRRLLPASALVQGSHALYYGFSTLHWQAAGLSPALIGLLWAEGVAAEVVLFLAARRVADRLGARGLALVAAGAGVLRWAVCAGSTDPLTLAGAQLLHAATFGAMHLGAMRVLATLPAGQAAAAQTLHGSLGPGLASLGLMLLSGPLYAALGGAAFWAMAALCAAAVPFAARLPRGA